LERLAETLLFDGEMLWSSVFLVVGGQGERKTILFYFLFFGYMKPPGQVSNVHAVGIVYLAKLGRSALSVVYLPVK
jgi:hypothetical protein